MKTRTLLPIMIVAAIFNWNLTKPAEATDNLTPDEAQAIAAEAFVYGFPMVIGYKLMYAYAIDKESPEFKGPFNHLGCEARVYTPEDKAIVTPNSDTPYCFVSMDLRHEPYILTVPKLEVERYYSWQFIDMYTHNFAYVGTLTTGNGANKYLIAGPNWKGKKPAGISKIIRSETEFGIAIVRTQFFAPGDLSRVEEIQSKFKFEPMSNFRGKKAAKNLDLPKFPEWVEGSQADERFFAYFDFMLSLVNPVDEEKPLMERFTKIGLGTDKPFNIEILPSDIREALKQGVKTGLGQIGGFLKKYSSDPLASAKIFGTRDFLTKSALKNFGQTNLNLIRAAAAYSGLYGNTGTEAIYPSYFVDSTGKPLDSGQSNYTLTFKKGHLPPVKSFWSLTMYDDKTQLLVSNPIKRYLLNSMMVDQFKKEEDGSIILYLQKDSPGKELESNWLPAPDGRFYAALRLYGPKSKALDGKWSPPSMERTK